jgi:hypothetical protein
MAQSGDYVFVTGYVYNTNGQPVWATAQMNRTGAAAITFSGPLYLTTGPYFGGTFNPNFVSIRQAGTMTFVLTGVSEGQLNYSVDGVVVNKAIQRQPLTLDDYSGSYATGVTQTTTGCFNSGNNGTTTAVGAATISQAGSSMSIVTSAAGLTCTANGTYSQLGRMGSFIGPYSCNTGEIGTASAVEMTKAPFIFTARVQFQSSNIGCLTVGETLGLIPR